MKDSYKLLYDCILKLETLEEADDFFSDLCTPKEIEQMSQRIKAAELLMDNKTYLQVIEETDISSATLSRVSKCVKQGKGYNNILNK